MGAFNVRFWLKFSLINLTVVAALGVLLRYKIGFDFPFLEQRNIHHAHSHLAFTGWITHTLFVLMIQFISKQKLINHNKYHWVLAINLLSAYGMLGAFFFTGYSYLSVSFILLSIVASIVFTAFAFTDFKKVTSNQEALPWFKAALIFNLASSAGTIYLTQMMLNHQFDEHGYLAAEYFYLHFQYNGFFIFSCFGFAIIQAHRLIPGYQYRPRVFYGFLISVIPAYFLSTLWAHLPNWLYMIVIVAAALQILAWADFLLGIRKAWIYTTTHRFYSFLLSLVAIAFTIKIVLQLGSTIPQVSKLAFGFRHIVIAYLHLVLLGVVSGFLLSHLYSLKLFKDQRKSIWAMGVFMGGVIINELILAIQGIASFSYIAIPYANSALLGAAMVLLAGSLMMLGSQQSSAMIEEL